MAHPYSGITRRRFLYLTSLSACSLAIGCATNPVTGKSQLMLVSEGDEIALDRQSSPHQFSADYGQVQDPTLVDYIDSVGRPIAAVTHRPDMPYRFVPLNASYVNAYTFPAGSVGITRGILIGMESEAELASLIGHELGHVNARHTAQRMTKGALTSVLITGVSTYVGSAYGDYQDLAAGLGGIAAGALLARYSRDNEREADALGMQYMVQAGYHPRGQIELMDMLRSLSKGKPNVIEVMFATHPMSEERYQTAVKKSFKLAEGRRDLVEKRERYMDTTAALRSISAAIEQMQKGDRTMMGKKYGEAEGHYKQALRLAPGDYAGLLSMAKCQLALERPDAAKKYAEDAVNAYPAEPQALHVRGFSSLRLANYGDAYDDFSAYEKKLPGNPNTVFFKGYCLEKRGRRQEAADHYIRYLDKVRSGEYAEYAYQRLVEWGYVK